MKAWTVAIGGMIALALSATSALCAPVTWTVTGMTDDGGSLSGSFAYDADTGTYSGVNITTSGGAKPGATYTVPYATYSTPNALVALTSGGAVVGQPIIALSLSPSSSPRTVNGREGECNASCNDFGGITRAVSGTAVLSAPAPVPTLSEWSMILLGLVLAGGAAWTLHRQHKAA